MATAALRLTGNIAFNRGNGTVVQMEQVGFPAHVITSGRLDSARLPSDPQILGNLTPVANVTYDLGSATHRWKDLWLSGNTIVLGNTFIREGADQGVQLGGASTTVTAEAFAGNGALLTHLDASQLTSGTVPAARFGANVRIGQNAGTGSYGEFAVAVGLDAGTSDQQTNAVAVGTGAGGYGQGSSAVAIGSLAGEQFQSANAVAIGLTAGQSTQGSNAVAVGFDAGKTSQRPDAVAIGAGAGVVLQGPNAVAIGRAAAGSPSQLIGQGSNAVAIGTSAGHSNQGSNAVAIGQGAGSDAQNPNTVAVGWGAGGTSQGFRCVAVGDQAGGLSQGPTAVAFGHAAGVTSQGSSAVAIGVAAGRTLQGLNAVAIGELTGESNQGNLAVAVGRRAGLCNQGSNAVAIGSSAGHSNQAANCIVINATGGILNNTVAESCVIKPVRNFAGAGGVRNVLLYDASAGEFSTNSANFVVDTSDRVGIGNPTPAYTLDVSGTARITSNLFFNSQVQNNMITLYGTTGLADTDVFGFGVNSGTLRYNTGASSVHRWYASTTSTMHLGSTGQLSARGNILAGYDGSAHPVGDFACISYGVTTAGGFVADNDGQTWIRGIRNASGDNLTVFYAISGNLVRTSCNKAGSWFSRNSYNAGVVRADNSATNTFVAGYHGMYAYNGRLENLSYCRGINGHTDATAAITVAAWNGTAQQNQFYVTGTGVIHARSTTITSLSDERFKRDIEDAHSQWEDVKALRWRRYRLKDEVESQGSEQAKYYLGVISQEIANVCPQSVGVTYKTDENNLWTEEIDHHTVNYSALWMKSCVALQEAMARIEALETRLAALENK